MKGKKLLSVLLVGILAFALGLGTMALYTRTFTSADNIVNTAKFKVSSNGTLNGNEKFEILGQDLYPGAKLDAYEFEIDQKDTEVPVKYTISVIPEGRVFGERNGNPSPLELTLLKKVDGEWVNVGGLSDVEIIPDKLVEKFKIHLEWPHNDAIDADFEDLGGSINIEVIAQQVVEEDPGEEDPGDEEPGEPTIKVKAYVDIHDLSVRYIDVEVENLKGADQFEIEYKAGDINPRTVITERTKIGAPREDLPAVPRRINKGDIRIYDAEDNLLHEFKSVSLIKIL